MSFQHTLTELLAIQTNPYTKAKEWKTTHQRKVIANLPPDVPEEIIHASGAFPLAVTGRDRKTSLADSHIPPFIDYVRSQILELVNFLGRIAGKPLNHERLGQIVEISNQTTRLWKEIIDSARHIPAPISVFDQFISMAPIVAQRGSRAALEFYQKLKTEIDGRMAKGIGALTHEKYRLYWDSLPLWHELRWLSDLLVSFGACLVSTIYTLPWAHFELDPKDPVSSWVEEYVHYFDWHLNRRVELILQLKERYGLNGFVFHNDRSCKMFSTAIPEIRRIVQEKTGIPAYILEGDHGDPRFYSKEQIEKGLTYYFELLEARR